MCRHPTYSANQDRIRETIDILTTRTANLNSQTATYQSDLNNEIMDFLDYTQHLLG